MGQLESWIPMKMRHEIPMKNEIAELLNELFVYNFASYII